MIRLGRCCIFKKEPISSPLNGWEKGNCRNHHDYINPSDFPEYWLNLDITVEVEAKAKELAVLKLKREIEKTHRLFKSYGHGPWLLRKNYI